MSFCFDYTKFSQSNYFQCRIYGKTLKNIQPYNISIHLRIQKNARTEIQTHERQIRNKQQSTMKSDQLKTAIVLRDTNHAMHNLRHVT